MVFDLLQEGQASRSDLQKLDSVILRVRGGDDVAASRRVAITPSLWAKHVNSAADRCQGDVKLLSDLRLVEARVFSHGQQKSELRPAELWMNGAKELAGP